MPITDLADMSAPVLSATLLMNPPASQYRQRPPQHRTPRGSYAKLRKTRRSWKLALKSVVRPLVPIRVRRKVRLVLVASNGTPDAVRPAHAGNTDTDRRAA